MQKMQNNVAFRDFDLWLPKQTLLQSANFVFVFGNHYGMIGKNGIGKSTLLKRLENSPELQEWSVVYVEQEIQAHKDKSVYQCVLESNARLCQLLRDKDVYLDDPDKLQEIYDELRAIESDKQDSIVRKILVGLGFSKDQHDLPVCNFSGGWRMRIALAKALYLEPDLLLLDEPTNHLDLNAVIWLTDYLAEYKKTFIVVSHNQNFLDDVCTDIILFENMQLSQYKGNYSKFQKQYEQQIAKQQKEWEKLCKVCKSYKTKKERQAYKEKNSHVQQPPKPYKPRIRFGNPLQIKHPIWGKDITFGYNDNDGDTIFKDLEIGIDMESRMCIVGPNGVGKTTLFKLLMGKLVPTKGEIFRDSRLRIGYYHQHFAEILPPDKTPIEYLQSVDGNLGEHDARRFLGSLGLTGALHHKQIKSLSGGQKARVTFGGICAQNPHILLLDEPTNHLDIETVNALIQAINDFEGGVVMISHDAKLITETDSVLYVVDDKKVLPYNGDYQDYKEQILSEME